jgi:hypothetical protein
MLSTSLLRPLLALLKREGKKKGIACNHACHARPYPIMRAAGRSIGTDETSFLFRYHAFTYAPRSASDRVAFCAETSRSS